MLAYDDYWSKRVKKSLTYNSNWTSAVSGSRPLHSQWTIFWGRLMMTRRSYRLMSCRLNAEIAVANYKWLESVREGAPRFIQAGHLWHLIELRAERAIWVID